MRGLGVASCVRLVPSSLLQQRSAVSTPARLERLSLETGALRGKEAWLSDALAWVSSGLGALENAPKRGFSRLKLLAPELASLAEGFGRPYCRRLITVPPHVRSSALWLNERCTCAPDWPGGIPLFFVLSECISISSVGITRRATLPCETRHTVLKDRAERDLITCRP